jgi:peptidoglycan/LPS O-acetylase OafA/YrhL
LQAAHFSAKSGGIRKRLDSFLILNTTCHDKSSRKAIGMTTHRRDIDGLRALAVLPVLLFHADLAFPGGFVGVDVFFVISGFLITSLILKELCEGNFSLVNFWERRIRRILPALSVVVAASLIAGWFLYLPEDLSALGSSAVAQSLLLANVFFLRATDYFGAAADTKPLLHTWSLAVEEQFYLLFPLLLIWLARKRLSVQTIILCLAVISFIASAVGWDACRAIGCVLPVTYPSVGINAWRCSRVLLWKASICDNQ